MNEARRKMIKDAVTKIEDAANAVEVARDEEQESFDNMPENMQQGEKGMQIEANIQYLSDAMDALDNAKTELDSVA